MQSNQQQINPDVIIQRLIQARMDAYRAKEIFEAALKNLSDENENVIALINLMKSRILELEDNKGKQPDKNEGKKDK